MINILGSIVRPKIPWQYIEDSDSRKKYELTFKEYSKKERNKLQNIEGKLYRNHWNAYIILMIYFIIPMVIMGMMEFLFTQDPTLLALATSMIIVLILPLALVGVILNHFIGKNLCVFQEHGFWALSEVEAARYYYFSKMELIYIPYESIKSIKYTESLGRYFHKECEYPSVVVCYQKEEGRGKESTPVTCILRCSYSVLGAREYARQIAKRTNGIKVKRKILWAVVYISIMVMVYGALFVDMINRHL